MSAKGVAQGYWTRELEEELEELGIREKWLFTTNTGQPFSGVMKKPWSLLKEIGLKSCMSIIAQINARKRVYKL